MRYQHQYLNKVLMMVPFLYFVVIVVPSNATASEKNSFGSSSSDSSQYYVQEIINSKKPVLIDFWAAWCGPCKILSPLIQHIKKEYAKKIKVLKINVDRNRSLASHFQVTSIPSVFIVKDKIVVNKILGVQPKQTYREALDQILDTEGSGTDTEKPAVIK